MAPAGRPPIDPEKHRVKVNMSYTSVERWIYNAIVNEARERGTNVTTQIETALTDYARKLRRRKSGASK
jgi:hypothetical protein